MELHVREMENELFAQEYSDFRMAHLSQLEQVDKNAYQSDMLGWVDVNACADNALIENIVKISEEVRRCAEVFVVVGLGGSNQGARAVIDALTPQARQPGGPEILYAARNLSAAHYQKILDRIGNRSVYINVIAKNFKTLEPGLIFRMLRNYLEGRYGKKEAAQRIITTPTIEGDVLHKISKEQGYRVLPFPQSVGGRFSVFTAVGLLPIAVAGVDIHALLKGAKKAQGEYLSGGALAEKAKKYAIARNLYLNKGYGIEALAFFEPQLESFGRWWRQLFGESEGKQGTGLFPTVCSYTEDLHSVGQYMQQGKRQIIETFLHVKQPPADTAVVKDSVMMDGFAYLDGKTMHEINECAYQATVDAHSSGGVPCLEVELADLSAQSMGELLYFFMVACYYSAVLLEVDPFDQPGVENYKKEMFRLLGAE